MNDVALSEAALSRIEAVLGAPEADASELRGVRRDFPNLTVTRCDASDVGVEEPFRRYRRYDLYLVDASEHCWRFTADPDRASGVVVAAKS